MPKNWMVAVEDDKTETRVVLPDARTALGVVNTFMLQGCHCTVCETQAPVTQKTGAAAEAYVKLRQTQLDLPIMRKVG